jgi:hypothetical protein
MFVETACSTTLPASAREEAFRQGSPDTIDPAIAAQFARYQQLAAEPTPASWHPGAVWDFVVYDGRGKVEKQLRFQVTGDSASTCLSGEWKRLVPVGGAASATSDPAYLLEGRNLLILLSTGLCDGYDELKGELSGLSFEGRHVSSGLLGGTDHGKVTGKAATP